MIGGAANADAAILVVDCTDFNTGYTWGSYKLKPQTLEHIRLLRNMGIMQIIVALNKIDMFTYIDKSDAN